MRAVAEQLGHDGLHAFERVGDRARLLEDFLLHVVAVRAELRGAAVRVHGLHRTRHRLAAAVGDPVLAQLHVDHVAFLDVDDLVRHAGQCHRIAGQEVLAVFLAHAQDHRRAGTGADHAVRFVLAEHGDRVGAVQAADGGLHGLEQVAFIQAVDQVADDLGVGLAGELVALGLQRGAQLVVVLDDPVVHQRDAAGPGGGAFAGAVAEMRMRVVHRRGAVRGPAGVGDAGAAREVVALHLGQQLRDARRAAGPLQAVVVHGDAARVIAAVFQPLQALDQDRDDVAGRDRGDDSTHEAAPWVAGL